MTTDIWNERSIICIDYFQKEKLINGEYYADLLYQFNDVLKVEMTAINSEECSAS